MHVCSGKQCKHEHVKYCDKCQKCYCEDCGMEWPQKGDTTYIPYYPQPYYPQWPQFTWTDGNACESYIMCNGEVRFKC